MILVVIPKRSNIDGKELKAFFKARGPDLPTTIGNLIVDTAIWCYAFYYSKDVVLTIFTLRSETGLIATLTGDANLGNLFELKGAAMRLSKCPKASINVLEKYVTSLAALSSSEGSGFDCCQGWRRRGHFDGEDRSAGVS